MMENILEHPASVGTVAEKKISWKGKILLGITGGVAVGITAICLPFISPGLRRICLPYVPATDSQVKNIISALKGRKGSLIDLGSGDGRIVFAAANENFTAHGIEMNPWLVLYSRLEAFRKGLSKSTTFIKGDLWKFSLRNYENIVIFGVEQMMPELEKKLIEECKNSVVVACRFPLPNLKPKLTIGHGIDTVWLYYLDKLNK